MRSISMYDDDAQESVFVMINPPVISVEYEDLGSRGYLRGKASAKCHPTDKFDENFGIELAGLRAKQRLMKKQEKRLIRSLDKK